MAQRTKKIGAFTDSQADAINSVLQSLYCNMERLHPFEFRGQDVLDMLIKPEHRATLDLASSISGSINNTTKIHAPTWSNAITHKTHTVHTLDLTILKPQRVLLPRYARGDIDEYAGNNPTFIAINKWVNEIVDIRHEFMFVRDVINSLRGQFTKPAEVAFYLPAIASLFKRTDSHVMRNLAQDIEASKPPRAIAAIHPELRKACVTATEIIAKVFIMPEVTGADTEVRADISATQGVTRPWYGSDRLTGVTCYW